MNKISLAIVGLLATTSTSVFSEEMTKVTYKAAKSTSSYYQMAVQVAEGVKKATDDGMIITVEESQGSVQNVKEASKNRPNYIFTSPPALIDNARASKKPFRASKKEKYDDIRALYPIPALTMHWVVSKESEARDFSDLKGKDFIIGRGNYAARKTEDVLKALELDKEVNALQVELNGAVTALKNGKVSGFATSSSYPAPNVIEVASSLPINLISLSDSELAKVKGTPVTIPANTYKGVDYPVQTISLPVGTYTLKSMSDETAYQLTKAFWQSREEMAGMSPWWQGVQVKNLKDLAGPLHPGAKRYYQEQNIALPENLK
ncbi:TAXI family TRAP transporter solute-binding subunit [Vibrio sp. SS-MA-C1-2]|uniref:TAXI family TRAP transporter solute-binding subunit n=1 Tax=Vibrio sp. SS-MA-C1-2 TaxID=2908646 RepID=UPI001F2FA8FF|nr:TAXI family TRAP transporter solute-binding subunit [Vibrio sp. SS-MA-C1-2]UJF17814.1 TAXI family TRAP transporter solute-binding subunit [Vibrio sp. SS-MA-C1-2]